MVVKPRLSRRRSQIRHKVRVARRRTHTLRPINVRFSWLRGAEISPDGGMSAFATSDALGLAALRL